MRKKWRIKPYSREASAKLASELGVSQLLAGALLNRGITTKQEGELFLHPEMIPFYDPFLLPDMDKAVNRIVQAITNKEQIVVFGDYDADGITATSLLLWCLQKLGAWADYYIPDRFSEGYGLKSAALERLCEQGFQLVITVDCGVKSVEEIQQMKGKMDFVVTDHHLPGDELPDAVAVVDAHRKDSEYPCPELAGVGISFKLCQALWKRLRNESFTQGLELVALGTVADAVPLTRENRRIVSEGIAAMSNTSFVGLRALMEVSGFSAGKTITSSGIGFGIAPRINAAGRLKTARLGVELLLCEDEETAVALASELNDINNQRRQLKDDIQLEAEEKLKSVDVENTRVLVVDGHEWHHGVIGLVASWIQGEFYRPVIVISIKDGIGKGSCRSIPGFNLYEALERCSGALLQFGGHEMAAGLTIREENIPRFRAMMEQEARRQMKAEDFIPYYDIDQELSPLDVSMDMVEELSLLEPCGMKNEGPLFACHNVRGSYASLRGTDFRHLRFNIGDGTNSVTAMAFNMAEELNRVNRGPVDMVYELCINEWNDVKSLQCIVRSMDTPLPEEQKVLLNREFLKGLFLFLRECRAKEKPVYDDVEWLSSRMRMEGYQSCSEAVAFGLAVFSELGLVSVGNNHLCLLHDSDGKLDLNSSVTFRSKGAN